MKKTLVIFLAAFAIFLLCACGDKAPETDSSQAPVTTTGPESAPGTPAQKESGDLVIPLG